MQVSRILLVLCLTSWVTVGLARVTYHLATRSSQNCYDVCQSRGLICSATNHGFSDNNVRSIFRRLGTTCLTNQILAPYSLDTEPFVIGSGSAKICSGWKSIPSRINCAAVPSYKTKNVLRLCPCSKTGVKAISSCSGTPKDIIVSSGVITSPNHPSNYKHGQFCVWRISAPHGYALKLTFSSFHLESHSKCNYDYVKLQDGMAYSSPLLGKYCGDRIPPARYANSGSMVVTFKSDGSVSHDGFRASFTSVPIVTGCSGTPKEISGSNGVITSPNFPNNYGMNQRCVWKIQVPSGKRVQLAFTFFQLEGPFCADVVEVRNGKTDASPQLGRYCGLKAPPTLYADSGSMRITFVSDSSVQRQGFHAVFTAVPSNWH